MRILYVELVEYVFVEFGSIGSCADVKDKLNQFVIAIEPLMKMIPVYSFLNLGAVKIFIFASVSNLSTAMIALKLSAFNLLIRQLPMKPAAPVTIIMTASYYICDVIAWLVRAIPFRKDHDLR